MLQTYLVGGSWMKRLSFIISLIILTLSLGACSNSYEMKSSLKEEGIAPYSLNESEEYLLESFGLINDSQLISFNAPKEAIALLVNLYSLDDNGNWQEVTGGGGISIGNQTKSMEHLEGTFAMILRDDYSIDWVLRPGATSNMKMESIDFNPTISAKAFLTDFVPIKLNQEIPVAIMVYDCGTNLRSFAVESYFEPDIFEGMDSVQAVTLTFTDKEL